MLPRLSSWRGWAPALNRETYALYLAGRDPRTPYTGDAERPG